SNEFSFRTLALKNIPPTEGGGSSRSRQGGTGGGGYPGAGGEGEGKTLIDIAPGKLVRIEQPKDTETIYGVYPVRGRTMPSKGQVFSVVEVAVDGGGFESAVSLNLNSIHLF
ncbi:MAG: hypothetical protein QW728_07425, partial [Thermoplasmata archaeon]